MFVNRFDNKEEIVLKKILLLSILTIGLLGSVATTALAYEVNVGGGTWNYGNGKIYSWSNYYHKSKTHKSSVTVGNYTTSSGWISKNKWAKASAKKSLWSTSQFYWNTK